MDLAEERWRGTTNPRLAEKTMTLVQAGRRSRKVVLWRRDGMSYRDISKGQRWNISHNAGKAWRARQRALSVLEPNTRHQQALR